MKEITIYESEDSIIRVRPHETEEKNDLAYITLYVGRAGNYVHINRNYVPVLYDILGGLKNIYKIKESE